MEMRKFEGRIPRPTAPKLPEELCPGHDAPGDDYKNSACVLFYIDPLGTYGFDTVDGHLYPVQSVGFHRDDLLSKIEEIGIDNVIHLVRGLDTFDIGTAQIAVESPINVSQLGPEDKVIYSSPDEACRVRVAAVVSAMVRGELRRNGLM